MSTTEERPRATIVLVTYNSLERTRELLAAIEAYTPLSHELLVLDNGSTDGTLDLLRCAAGASRLRLVESAKNLRCAHATNAALALCETEYVVYLCASHALVLGAGWLEELVRYMDDRPSVGIGGHVWNPGFTLESKHYALGWTPGAYGLDRLAHVQGGAWIARRAIFHEVGDFFAEEYPQGGMDVEFSYRLLSLGRQLGEISCVSCPPWPKEPGGEGALVVHPATMEQRRSVRHALGLGPLPFEIERDPLEGWRSLGGDVAPFPNSGVLVRSSGAPAGLVSTASWSDVKVSGAVDSRGARVVVRVRASPGPHSFSPGYALVVGDQRGLLTRGAAVLGSVRVAPGRRRFSLEVEGTTVRAELGGEELRVEDHTFEAGHVLLAVEVGEALFSDVLIEPGRTPCAS